MITTMESNVDRIEGRNRLWMEGRVMPLADETGWYAEEVFKLLFDERLSGLTKLLVWFLGSQYNGVQISREELSDLLSTNSKSTAVQRAIEEAERYGYIEVDRTIKPYWYRVI
ncbi:hypothetical protein ACFV2N_15935 [Streptomyces sp. NPDC059680]|uniref:hypothetical protein n=1 Tax=Streptomyces sp. NPDC059680 TaxID=3346904 RepID=UPI0036B66632